MRQLLGSILTAVVISAAAEAQTVRKVPADYPTIQAAINAATNFDTVRVSPGVYFENINFLGKAITVVSEEGPDVTTIDGRQLGTVVTFESTPGPFGTIDGFTIRNGKGSSLNDAGGGIRISGSHSVLRNRIVNNIACSGAGIAVDSGAPFIRGNVISDNATQGCTGGMGGAGIRVISSGSPSITENIISNNFNYASSEGGGISFWNGGSPFIVGNIITGNYAARGGGIGWVSTWTVTMIQNVIAGNTAQLGGGIYWFVGSANQHTISNNTIVDNDAAEGSAIYTDGFSSASSFRNNFLIGKTGQRAVFCKTSSPPLFEFNDVYVEGASLFGGMCPDVTGTNGNISAAPVFVNRAARNFRLLSGSPGIDAGTTNVSIISLDLDGFPRLHDGTLDIGAYEFAPAASVTLSSSSLTFPDQPAGTVSAPLDVTLTNTGTTKLAIPRVAVTGEFSDSGTCRNNNGFVPGQSCTFSIRFAPQAGGPRSGQLTFTGNAVGTNVVTLTGTGQGPLALSTSTVTFSDQRVGTNSPAATVTVSNTGSQNLDISSIVTTGSSFSSTIDCPASLSPASSCTISILFSPTARGTRAGTITLTNTATGSPHSISLSGVGVAPAVSFIPANLQFGFVGVGQSSGPQPITITNQGELPLQIDDISITGEYSGTHDCPASLAASATCTVSVVFSPTALFFRSGTMTVVDNAPGSPHTVPLGGAGANPQLTTSPTGLVFGAQTIFTTSLPQGILLRNTGTSAVTITGIVASSEFSASTNCTTTLFPNGICSLQVTFRPTGPGIRTGTLTITSSGLGSPNVVPLSGTGLVGGVSLTPTISVFAPDNIGTSSPPRTVTLQNHTAGPITISGITTTGDFTETNNCGTSLPFGGACAINVVFSPDAAGVRTGSLTIASNVAGSPHTGALEGTGLTTFAVPVITTLSPNSRPAGAGSAAVTINGTGFSSQSVVFWNGSVRPTTFVNQTRMIATLPASDFTTRATVPVFVSNPAPGGGESNRTGFVVYLPVTVTTNDLIYDRVRNRIYATVPATAPSLANTLTPIDPVTGTFGNSVFMGPDPTKLAISGDSSTVYVALEGSNEVRPFETASQTPGTAFTVGSEPQIPYSAEDIAVSPDNPRTIAVSRKDRGFNHEGVAIFDNGVMRPFTTPDHTGSNLISFSTSPSILYGYNNQSTEFGFRTMSISASGAVVTNVQQNLISGPVAEMQFEDGRIYASSGRVIDPVTRTLLGTFPLPQGSGPFPDLSRGVVVDSKLKRAFFLIVNNNSASLQILAFDVDTFAQTGSVTLPPPGQAPTIGSLVRWGERGLAFRSETQVFLFEIPENWLPARNISRDFNGDRRSDVLWRNNAGDVSLWQLNGFSISNNTLIANIWTDWTIAGSGDFNGDGKSDVLWRNLAGDVVVWLMNGATVSSYGVAGNLPTSWTVSAVGDLNGDGKADILWRETSGNVAAWLMNGTVRTSSTTIANIWTGWIIAGAADFDGDARTDVLWRSVTGDVAVWLMNGTSVSGSAVVANIWTGWTIAGTGDFDGDGRADVLWRDPSGNIATWQMNGLTVIDGTLVGNIWIGWSIARTGDFDGDGKADILWRDTSGNVAIWLMNGTAISSYAAMGNVSDRLAQ